MIRNPFLIVFTLIAIEAIVLFVSEKEIYKKNFSFIPALFWIYFLPMLGSSLGLIDGTSPIHSFITNNFLPASLILLLMCVDINAIMHLGRLALGMFFIGSLGIMAGTVLVFAVLKDIVGPQFWSGFGAISASWTGGSANMIAVKEALATPQEVFAPMVVVDTVLPSVWMGILVLMVGFQKAVDSWNHSRSDLLEEFNRNVKFAAIKTLDGWHGKQVVLILAIALAGSVLGGFLAKGLPEIKGVVSTYAWTIIIVSFLGVGLSFSPYRNLERYGASHIGTWILYFVLTTIGVKANLTHLGSSFIFIFAGACILFVHGIFMLVGARLLRAPLFLVAIASQANIGGVASAPLLAAFYQPTLAPVGLLLAVLGNIFGTYLGIITGQLCHWMVG